MTLKALTKADRDLILPWRNDPKVRQYMFHTHEISQEEHREWFDRMQNEPDNRWYLWYDNCDTPGGVVYFTQLDIIQRTAFWGFYARPGAEPGTGTRILFEALDHAFGELGLSKLNGEAIATNIASVRLHEKCGFSREGTFRAQYFDGKQRVDVIRFGLLEYEWATCRDKVRALIDVHTRAK